MSFLVFITVLAQAAAAAEPPDSELISWVKTGLVFAGGASSLAAAIIFIKRWGHKQGVTEASAAQVGKTISGLEESLKAVKTELDRLRGIDEKGSESARRAINKLEGVLHRLTDKFQVLSNGYYTIEERHYIQGEKIAALERVDTHLQRFDTDLRDLRDEVRDLVQQVGELAGRVNGHFAKGT